MAGELNTQISNFAIYCGSRGCGRFYCTFFQYIHCPKSI